MWLIVLKLADVAARSLFLLLTLYALPDREAGQFGLVMTLVNWFMFVAGYERYVDLQRAMVGQAPRDVHHVAGVALRFFGVNQVVLAPFMVIVLIYWARLDWWAALLVLIVAVAEHLSQEIYRLALVAERYRAALVPVVLKNAALAALAGAGPGLLGHGQGLQAVVVTWATVSTLGLLASLAVVGLVGSRGEGLPQFALVPTALGEQYRRSWRHFAIGLLGLASVQLDRFVISALLPFESGAVYFRHVLLASFVYSALSIASYNRILPAVYAAVRECDFALAKARVRRERMLLTAFAGVVAVVGLFACNWTPPARLVSAGLSVQYLQVLLIAFLVRLWADYNAMLLNAAHREADVLRVHLLALPPSLAAGIAATLFAGLPGAVAGFAAGAVIYFVVSSHQTRRALG